MPDGQFKTLKPEEIRDLVAYLASPAQVPLPGEGPYFDPKTGKVAGALEGETLKVKERTAGATGAQGMSEFKLGKWSGDSQLWWTGGKPGDKLAFDVNVQEAGDYEVFVVLTKAIDYGIVALSFDDGKPTGAIDLFNDGVINTPPISLGTYDLKPGAHTLHVEIKGANAKAVKAYMFGIDYVHLAKKK
jgi:hypothetical protein